MTQSFTTKNEKPKAVFVVYHFGRPFGEICRHRKWEDRFFNLFWKSSNRRQLQRQ